MTPEYDPDSSDPVDEEYITRFLHRIKTASENPSFYLGDRDVLPCHDSLASGAFERGAGKVCEDPTKRLRSA